MRFHFSYLNGYQDRYQLDNIIIEEGDDKSEVVIPDTYNGKPVTQIGNWIFHEFGSELKTVVFGDNVDMLPMGLFIENPSLETIYLGKKTSTIYPLSEHCPDLKNVYYNGTKENLESKESAKWILNEYNVHFGIMHDKVQLRQDDKPIFPITHWNCVKGKPESFGQGGNMGPVPTKLSDLEDDETHRLVTDEEKESWNAKSDFSGSYNDLTDVPCYDFSEYEDIDVNYTGEEVFVTPTNGNNEIMYIKIADLSTDAHTTANLIKKVKISGVMYDENDFEINLTDDKNAYVRVNSNESLYIFENTEKAQIGHWTDVINWFVINEPGIYTCVKYVDSQYVSGIQKICFQKDIKYLNPKFFECGSIAPEKLDREYTTKENFDNVMESVDIALYNMQTDIKINGNRIDELKTRVDDLETLVDDFEQGSIADGSVTEEKLADGSVTEEKLADLIKNKIDSAYTLASTEPQFNHFLNDDIWNFLLINDENSSFFAMTGPEACVELEKQIGNIGSLLDDINGEVV